VIELYAFTDAAGPPLPDASPLRAVASRDLAAVCAPAEEGEVTPDRLWRHEQVVESLMADRDVLPVRFGTRVQDEESVVRIVQDNYDRLVESLDFVRGASELSVRVYAARPDGGSSERSSAGGEAERPETGTAYLRARARRLADEQETAGTIHEPLAAAARAAKLRPTRAAGELLCGAYLVGRADVERFAELIRALEREHPDLRLISTGPWPPYSFAER
jgi:hypothetical protein